MKIRLFAIPIFLRVIQLFFGGEVVGYGELLTRLSDAELSEYHHYCGYKGIEKRDTHPGQEGYSQAASVSGVEEYENPSSAAQQLLPEERVYSGDDADLGEYPGAAALSIFGMDLMCSATLITTRHIMTAAHCVNKNGSSMLIQTGGVCIFFSASCWNPLLWMNKIKLYRLTYWQQGANTGKNDIAIIELKAPIELSWRNHYACLVPPGEPLPSTAWMTGWGAFSKLTSATAFRLQKGPVRFEPAVCSTYGQICSRATTDRPDVRVGKGDSGGGTYVLRPNARNDLFAVNSFYSDVYNGHYDLTHYYEELCYYINLCMPGYNASTIDPRKWDDKKWKLDTVALADG